jgi:hypothetical protein
MYQSKMEDMMERLLAQMEARMKADNREMKANLQKMMAKMDAWLGEMKASPENDSSHCCLSSRYQVTSTFQAHSVHVTISCHKGISTRIIN